MPKTKSSPGVFQTSIRNISVWFIRQRNLGTFLEAIARTLDAANEGLYRGLRLGNPLRCPAAQLPVISKDRRIRIYPTEPTSSKRHRLSKWRQLRRSFGSHYGEMLNIQPFFLGLDGKGPLPTIRIVHQSGAPAGGVSASIATWHTLAPDGTYSVVRRQPSNWNWDGVQSKWSRWWVILYWPPGFPKDFDWDDGTEWDYGDGLWDGVDAAVFADLFAGLLEAKASHSRCCGLITTTLQPTDDIPGFPGIHPFDPLSDFTLNLDGSTNLPIGNWGELSYSSGAYLGHNTRAPWATFYNWTNG